MPGERRTEYLRLPDLQRAHRNPKLHDKGEIRSSIKRFGYVELMTIDERTGRMVTGHGRLDELIGLRADGAPPPDGVKVDEDGEWLIPVNTGWASADDTEADAYLILANRLSERGGWDGHELAGMLAELDEQGKLDGVGYDQDELSALLDSLGPTEIDLPPFDLDPEPTADTTPTTGPRTTIPDPGFTTPTPPPPAAPVTRKPPVADPFGNTPAPEHTPAPVPQPTPTPDPAVPQTDDTRSYQLAWSANHHQRQTITDAIHDARDRFMTDSNIAALTEICADYLYRIGNP